MERRRWAALWSAARWAPEIVAVFALGSFGQNAFGEALPIECIFSMLAWSLGVTG